MSRVSVICTLSRNLRSTHDIITLKRKLQHIIPCFFLLVFCNEWGSAQPVVKAMVNRTTIRTGEPVTIKLSALWPGKSGFTNGFIIPDSIPHFDIWEQQQPTAVKDGIEQLLTLTSYDSGQFTIPAFKLTTPTITTGNDIATENILIDVKPVNVDSLKDYHDIKDIIDVPPIEQWPYILGIAIATLLASIGLYFLLKKMGVGKKPTRRNFENGLNPFAFAMAEFDKLELDSQQSTINPKLYFTRLTDIYRTYLNDAHQFQSHQQTGGELILQARPMLQEAVFFQFANAVRLSDAAKFAKYDPPKTEWISSINIIKQTITEMDKHLYKSQSIAQ